MTAFLFGINPDLEVGSSIIKYGEINLYDGKNKVISLISEELLKLLMRDK